MKWRPIKSYLGKPLNLPTGKAWYEEDILNAERFFIKQFDKSYYSSQNEELQKAFENNKEQLMELATHAKDLESTIDEKNKEIERLKKEKEEAFNEGFSCGANSIPHI